MYEDMEPDEIMEDEAPRPAPKKGKSKMMIMIPMVLVMIAASYFIVVKFLLPKYPEAEEGQVQEEEVIKRAPDEFGFTWGYKGSQTVTLWDGKRNRFCVISITFESMEESVTTEELPKRETQIKDMVRSTVSSKTMDQLNNPVFQEDTLKPEILAKMNDIMPEGKLINRIFLDEFILQ